MCADINGVASPCHPGALVPDLVASGFGICENAVGIDRFACAKDPTGSVVAVNPPNLPWESLMRSASLVVVVPILSATTGSTMSPRGTAIATKKNSSGFRESGAGETVYIQPGDDKLFDISLASGIGVFNVTEFTSAFGSVRACR